MPVYAPNDLRALARAIRQQPAGIDAAQVEGRVGEALRAVLAANGIGPYAGFRAYLLTIPTDEAAQLADAVLAASADEAPPSAAAAWPAPMARAAFVGLAGRYVDLVAPETEAAPEAVLVQFLAAFGNAVGRGPYWSVGPTRHHANLYTVIVGPTGEGRKGTSVDVALWPLAAVDAGWAKDRVLAGLSSGEGVIALLRDPTGEDKPPTDRRLLAVETEFGKTLRVMSRSGNSLGDVLKQGWDSGNLRTLTRADPLRASGCHISLIGHVTPVELRGLLADMDIANGFGNRIIWIAARRTHLLPHGGRLPQEPLAALRNELAETLDVASTVGEMIRAPDAAQLWEAEYGALSSPGDGIAGMLAGRAAAQVMRLAMLYALFDRQAVIAGEHLRAALAVWRYATATIRYLFQDATGDQLTDRVLALLGDSPDGLTRTEISHALHNNTYRGTTITGALTTLAEQRRIVGRVEQPTGKRGRPVERFYAAAADPVNGG